MVNARHAEFDDIDDIVRLREVMYESWRDASGAAWTGSGDPAWKADAAEALRLRLGEDKPTMAVTVVDAPDGSGGLAACATGVISERLPSPGNRTGRSGWIFNVSTDLDWRRRGYSRACMTALLEWFDQQSVPSIELRASVEGRNLYEQLGFTIPEEPAMRLNR
ncbi:GNAT family N-acetyltransferase [Glycomyces sp. NRRL B-16210]|uniref:GNAT family N-acetyltransferase n=1 Tax=Glycomyces sp. NRRL B-16210 TaxID=1463821 RepID=UPI0004C16815|nr:GNAT family N-acetyltransferase [Glycomyces sp. NRRL B-16210]